MASILKVDTIQDQSGNNIINENADTITIGASGDTITIPSGATLSNLGTASGFGLTWQSVQTTGFTAVKGNAYPCNTTSAGFTVTLPATPSAGDQVQLVDYAGTFDTNALTIDPNGEDIIGQASNVFLVKDRESITLTYIDSTQGWLPTSGYQEGTEGLAVPYSVDFLVIAGGGSGGSNLAGSYDAGTGGGGAGGYRNSYSTESSGGGGSSEASSTFTPSVVYTVTVGAGGASLPPNSNTDGNLGTDSSISGTGITTITSSGGGGGGKGSLTLGGSLAGGAGGGGGSINSVGTTGGSGTANQGYAGGNGTSTYAGGGGGGAGGIGSNASGTDGGTGGNGLASSITGSSVTRAGGGGGGFRSGGSPNGGTGGGGSGGISSAQNGVNGDANTGSGGGGIFGSSADDTSGAGGKGVVILRMPDANYSGTTTGSPTVNTNVGGSGETVIIFNDSGSYTG
jgi:hypothetical protein